MSKAKTLQQRLDELDLAVPLDDAEAEEILEAAGVDAEAALTRLLERIDDE